MFFNRQNCQQKSWRMYKKGKFFLYGCSLALAGSLMLVNTATVSAESSSSESTTAVTSTTNQISKPTGSIDLTPVSTPGRPSRTQGTLNFEIVNPSSQGKPIVIEYTNLHPTISDGDLLYNGEVIGTVTSKVETNIPQSLKMTDVTENIAPTDSSYKTTVTIKLNENADKYATGNHLPISIQTQATNATTTSVLTSAQPFDITASMKINGQTIAEVPVPVNPLEIVDLYRGDNTDYSAENVIQTVDGKETASGRTVNIIPGSIGLKEGDIVTIRKGPTIPFDYVTTTPGTAYELTGGKQTLVPVGDKGIAYVEQTQSGVRLVLESQDAKTVTYRVEGNLAEEHTPYLWTITGVRPTLNANYDGFTNTRNFEDLHITLTRAGQVVYENLNANEEEFVRAVGSIAVVNTDGLHSVYTEYYLDGQPMVNVPRDLVLSKVAPGQNYTARIKEFAQYEYVGLLDNTSAPIMGTSGDTDLVIKLNYRTVPTESKTITRTIKYVNTAGEEVAPSKTQTVTYFRTVKKDGDTGETIYGDWTSNQPIFEAVTPPTVSKHTTETTEIPRKQTTGDSTDETINVLYSPTFTNYNQRLNIRRTIEYVTEDNQKVAEPTVQIVTFTQNMKKNDVTGEEIYGEWETTETGTAFPEITPPPFDKYTPNQTTVPLLETTPDSSSTRVRVIYSPTISESTETKSITRTIKYVNDKGRKVADDEVQTVTYTRTVKTNEVTGEVTHGDWTTDKADFDEVTSPTIDKYTVDTPTVATAPTTVDTENSSVTVTYNPTLTEFTDTKIFTLTVKYQDEAGKKLADDKVVTKTYTGVLIRNEVTGEMTAKDFWTPDDGEPLLVVESPTIAKYTTDTPIVERDTAVDSTNEHLPGADYTETVVYTPIISESTETKSITRIIKYVDNKGQKVADDKVQTVTYTRTVKTNEATGQKEYGEWTTDKADFEEVTSPSVDKHTPDTETVSTAPTTVDTENSTVTVTYNPVITQTTEIKTFQRFIYYVYGGNEGEDLIPPVDQFVYYQRTVSTNLVTGEKTYGEWTTDKNTFDEVTVPLTISKDNIAYIFAGASSYSDLNSEGNVASVKVSPVDSSVQGVRLDYIAVVESTETKVITRTIKYVDANGTEIASPVTQTVTYTRTVSTNQVTGEVTYGEWTTDNNTFEAVTSPTVNNYSTETTSVDGATTTPDSQAETVTVTYQPAIAQSSETKVITRTIKYVDANGTEIASPVTQTVTYTRTVSTNQVTGEVTYGEWTTDKNTFDAVTSPTVANYTTKTTTVENGTITPDSKAETVTVVYEFITPAPLPAGNSDMPLSTTPSNRKVLPSTGEASSSIALALGSILLALLAMVGWKKKRSER